MDKTKILRRRKTSLSKTRKLHRKGNNMIKKTLQRGPFVLRKSANLKEYDPIRNLLDVDKMGAAFMHCLLENDTEGVLEIIEN